MDSRLLPSGMTEKRLDPETILNRSRIKYGTRFSTWFRMTEKIDFSRWSK